MPSAIPVATYRLQFTADFDFDAAATIVPYLKNLGITHLYASPFLKARHGSTHGYDIVDHNQFNPELGGAAGFARLSDALKQHDLGLILDFVPNHMGVHFADNAWWLDVLEWGPASPHAESFDIDWDMLPYRARGGVLLPILGSAYGAALDNGDIELRFAANEGSFSAWYFEHRLPIAPERYSEILRTVVAEAGAAATSTGKALLGLASRYSALRHPDRDEAPLFKKQLTEVAGAADIILQGLDAYRAGPSRPTQTAALHSLLERQHYKLGHWRLATSEINYRRFFDVNTLAGLRVEDSATFNAIHGLVRKLIAEDRLQGLRLDHIDGLLDPAQYFRRLDRLIGEAQGSQRKPFYVVVEKILGEKEDLPDFQGVQGTTGYEWLNSISQVLIEQKGLEELDETWRQASNTPPKLAPVLKEAKRRVLDTLLTSEFTVFSRLLTRIANGHYTTRDYSADSLRQAFELFVLHFPVYRTYIARVGTKANDRALIQQTIARACTEWFGADEGLFDFLTDALTLDLIKPGRDSHSKPRVRRFAFKVQQFTGPMMAKSLEDTAFYRFHRSLALNEVGGDPSADALPLKQFHSLMRKRARQWPHGMTATATHDTKRGEDARARLLALAELPGEWTSAVARWKLLNARHITSADGVRSPSAAFEYMLYQTLVGAWPLGAVDQNFTERIQAYALKAAREGKEETSWLNPNEAYENGLRYFVDCILDRSHSSEFIDSVQLFARRISLLGALNSLSQLTLKATLPGVPDFYQGTEFWDFSLVDPDNRRAVDFALRAETLASQANANWRSLVDNWPSGHLKLAWTKHLLKMRNDMADIFTFGQYRPLSVTGPHSNHVIAFARVHDGNAAIVALGRSFAPLTEHGRVWPRGDGWQGELLVEGYTMSGVALSGNRLPLANLFAELPVAIVKATYR